ncbi:MAG: DUF1611 domain-containing protein [Planctomycetales bacterium]|nr:DUF1611 domain-containing protein [Planctomycetales bacterium]
MALSIAPGGCAAAGTLVDVSPQALPQLRDFPAAMPLKWTWSCRALPNHGDWRVLADRRIAPQPGDVVLVQVDSLGYHDNVTSADNQRLRLYPKDCLVAVCGNRYATDAYEAEVDTVDNLQLLTGAGMVGAVKSAHRGMKRPSSVSFLGYLCDEQGRRVNLKDMHRPYAPVDRQLTNIVLMIGTSMNSGKTTTAAKLTKAMIGQGLRVAACKVTGSVSHRDLYELRSTGVHDVRDFSDYGFPSTYLCPEDELLELFDAILTDAARVQPDVVVMEVADGMLQRETQFFLGCPAVQSRVRGVVLTASCAASALFGVAHLQSLGRHVAAVSGRFTSSPLFVREFSQRCNVPVGSSTDDGAELARLVIERCRIAC